MRLTVYSYSQVSCQSVMRAKHFHVQLNHNNCSCMSEACWETWTHAVIKGGWDDRNMSNLGKDSEAHWPGYVTDGVHASWWYNSVTEIILHLTYDYLSEVLAILLTTAKALMFRKHLHRCSIVVKRGRQFHRFHSQDSSGYTPGQHTTLVNNRESKCPLTCPPFWS